MRKSLTLVLVMAALAAAPFALAAGGTALTGYGQPSEAVVNVAGSTESNPASTGGTLPFTGLDLAIVVVAAIGLAGIGFGLRRLGRNNS